MLTLSGLELRSSSILVFESCGRRLETLALLATTYPAGLCATHRPRALVDGDAQKQLDRRLDANVAGSERRPYALPINMSAIGGSIRGLAAENGGGL